MSGNQLAGKHTPIQGRLDPILRGGISGWTKPGARIVLTVDGVNRGAKFASEPRQFAWHRQLDEQCGFHFPIQSSMLDGENHEVRVIVEGEGELPGSPLYFSSQSVSGAIERIEGNVIHGTIQDDGSDRTIAIAGILGDEAVAMAIARRDSAQPLAGIRKFALILPAEVLSSKHQLLHVGVVGTAEFLSGSPVRLPTLRPATVKIRKRARPTTLAIKVAAPNIRVAHEWGDYHFANALRASLQRRGWVVRVDCADQWKRTGDDAVLALRGRHRYMVDHSAVNLLWIISHPDRLPADEPASFDHVFVASDIYAKVLSHQSTASISVMHQAADPAVFHPPEQKMDVPSPLLFVGNSRREYRTLVRWCVENNLDLSVYGSLWKGIIPERFIKGEYIDNTELHKWYGSCPILLNDHWDTMKEQGFLSNRLFDGSAAGAFIITDKVKGLASVFGDAIETAADSEELKQKIEYYLANPQEAAARTQRARQIVLEGHTFDHRADQIIEAYERVLAGRVVTA